MSIISKYPSLLRSALSLALTLCIAMGAGAQTLDSWQANEAVKPDGSGTQTDPYLVATPANLFWISLNVGKNGTVKAGASNKYYVQTADIDLSGKEWMPIGNQSGGGFFANYDGRGHVIRGMTIDWGNYALALSHDSNKTDASITHDKSSNIAYGLFGWFGGKVENLVIDGAKIMRQNLPTTDITEDLKIGVLAGVVSDSINSATRDIIIKNIIVRNSTITDSGIGKYPAPAYMVGGLIGDINCGAYSGTSDIKSNISISNVAVHADIDLAHTNIAGTSGSKGHQYYVGGIVGRMRSARYEHAPAKVIYSGSINSPMGITGPIFSFGRKNVATDQGYDNFTQGYNGEFSGDSGTLSQHMFFYDYTVQGTLFTATEPKASTSADRKYTFRTLKSIANQNEYTYGPEGMMMFQGVNHGTFKDMSDPDTRADVLEKLNIGNENFVFRFIWANDQFELQGDEEVLALERTTIFSFKAKVINLKAEKEYTYKWTLTDASGNTWSASCSTAAGSSQINAPSGDVVLKILSTDRSYPTVAIVGPMRPYHSLLLEIFDDETLLSSKSYDNIDDVKIKMVRDIFTTSTTTQVPLTDADGKPVLDGENNPVMQDVTTYNKEHFLFKADLEIEGIHYADNPDFFEGISFNWGVKKGSGDTATPDTDGFINLNNSEYKATSTGDPFPEYEAHILSTYVGNIRLKISCSNPDDPSIAPMPITSSVIDGERKDYLEMVNHGLHLRITLDEYAIKDGKITTSEFNPADYFFNTTAGNRGFYDSVAAKYDADGNLTDAKASVIKPLIFKVKVVDQFGNDWTAASDALSHYRIQWNYHIPGEGINSNQESERCDKDEPFEYGDGYYCSLNGRFDASMKDVADTPYGLKSDVELTAENYNMDVNGQKLKGQFKVIGDSILIIHPNLLNRTIGFWVRAKLFDINHDPQGNHPTVEILAFNQLGVKMSKNTADNTIEGKVIWKLDPSEGTYVSGSACDLIWYKNSDPTDPTKWVKVQETLGGNSRATTLNPALYDPESFYKLTYKSSNNIEVEQIFGPQNVVYVYDRAQTIANRELHTFDPYDDFTNQYYFTGNNTNHGHDPYHAVLTLAQAYKIIDQNGSADDNVIVLMGYMDDPDFLLYNKPKGDYNRCATITGAYGNIKGATLLMNGENTSGKLLRGATKFSDLTLYGGSKALHFYCGLNDVTFGKGLKMVNYANQSENNNGLGNYKSQQITIIGAFHNYDNKSLPYPETNKVSGKRLTMTFQSGTFGRIISGGRTNGGYNKTSFNILGHPEWPHRVKVVVDIEEPLTSDQKTVADYNIGLLVGGQTDGSLYCDSEIEMVAGTVGRYISGNISYGRSVGNAHPADTYFGSTILDLYGGQINELYGGTLGRHSESGTTGTDKCDAFFYGRSIINIHSGTINSQIFGAGAGGVTGLGDDTNHTPDILIPYYEGKDKTKLKYGPYATATDLNNEIPKIKLRNADSHLQPDENGDSIVLDLSKSYVEVNILGGTVKGNIYGGAYGYSDNITPNKAISEAGYLFGNSYVNISDGIVEGNIYGGGAGSDSYYYGYAQNVYNIYLQSKYDEANAAWLASHPNDTAGGKAAGNAAKNVPANITEASRLRELAEGNDPATSREKFNHVAQVFGNTSVNITGGTITGNIYGGGQGILGFDNMAKLTGNTSVKISGDVRIIGKVENGVASGGHVYGGASFGEIQGNTDVRLYGGYIGGNVFGGSEGNANHSSAATIYGMTQLLIDGAHINASIYGGCNVSSIRKPTHLTAEEKAAYGVFAENDGRIAKNTEAKDVNTMTKVVINGGTIGNNIYGGSRGDDAVAGSVTDIEGDTYLRINGGSYKNTYFLTDKDEEAILDAQGHKRYRDFNIFGGGEKKCTITGTAHLDVRTGLMNIPGMQDFIAVPDGDEMAESFVLDGDVDIFIPHSENPNSLATDATSKFQGPYMDLTYRRFSLYGGGYGEHTNCLNTDVYVNIPTTARKPHGRTLKVPYDHQSYFDIAGGGYSGDIGYWAKANGDPVDADSPATDYDHYVGGRCNVTIDGFTYCRKVIGGGFYGSCLSTNTKIICGSLRQVYGGSLLGYVHDKAYLEIGNRPEDLTDYTCETPEVNAMTNEEKAKWLNDYIYFTENVYGGNDVKGIIGTKQWSWTDGAKETVGGKEQLVHYYGQEGTDGGPLWQADIDKEETKGVVMNIYGGTFMGDVFGAGNGHYRGYYVPGWVRYDDGPARMYRMVRGINGRTYAEDVAANPDESPASVMARHRVYRTRPMVGSVNINIAGNKIVRNDDGSINEAQSDYVKFRENFYGGGSDCSIGQWNTILPMEDPRRLSTGGHLHMNIGGNVNFEKNLYMGNYGELFGHQKYLPAGTDIDLSTFNGSTTEELAKIGELAYDHWFFNSKEGHNRYEPGFPDKGEADGNFGMLGEHMFRGYLKNIEMEGDIELTFYKDLYQRQDLGEGNYGDYLKDENGNLIRKRWVPAELAVDAYDAENITMGSFFLGGKCGYMTNNTYNVYCYTDGVGKYMHDVDSETIDGHKLEQWGSVYRIVMPQGVTIKDKLVMGVEDAVTHFYKYNDKFTGNSETSPTYTFEGGLVTQTAYSFDHVAYNDMMTKEKNGVWNPTIFLPDDFYQNSKYQGIWNSNSYTLEAGIYAGTTIYRRNYTDYGLSNYMLRPNPNYTEGGTEPKYLYENNQKPRYGLAVVYNDKNSHTTGNEAGAEPFFGRRASRTASGDHQTVSKLTARCKFDPQVGDVTSDEANYKSSNDLRYGGIIYGGCYNSGVVIGDVILNVASDMLGKNLTEAHPNQIFGDLSYLSHYIGRVYGGGYGADTRNDGDTYINLLRDVKAMNVFGGGMQGAVNGDTYINYIGLDNSYIYGAIYGGGFQGSVGKYYWRENFDKATVTPEQLAALNDPTRLLSQAQYDRLPDHETVEDGVVVVKGKDSYHLYVATNGTNVTLISGNVDHVYGGSCMGDMYGATRVHIYDEVAGSLPHLDFSKYGDVFKQHWSESRLVVGTVYGGNDISGEIIHTDDQYQTETGLYDTNVEMTETCDESPSSSKTTPGSLNGYNGYPLVGNLYGGSNGDYGKPTLVIEKEGTADEKQYYVYKKGSKIEYATGIKNNIVEVQIGGSDTKAPMSIPNVGRANIDIQGGTVVNLYGGGDMSTITEKANIKIAYLLDHTETAGGTTTTKYGNIEARAGFKSDEELQRVWNTCHVTSQQQMSEILDDCEYETTEDDGNGSTQTVKKKGYTFKHNVYRVFGGNNRADMAIQPSWQLLSGHVGSVYSGANFGRMTYYDGSDPSEPRGLMLEIDSPDFHANSLYGGGRVGDIQPAVPTGADISKLYGSTLTIKQGVIDHVYGGNDVAGEVHYGSRVDIQGAISGDVYCAGNGDHVYQYGYPDDYEGDKTIIGEDYIIIDEETKSGYRYFILPLKDEFDASDDIQTLKAINSYRPNVIRSNLTIGSSNYDHPAYVHGSIYMGGNSATVLPSKVEGSNDFISFVIGSNVIINSIFMGSNGENLVDDNMITRTNERNSIYIGKSTDVLDEYFKAVDVEGLPKNFVLDPNITNVNIGNFFLGGNRGSMTTNKTIAIDFPENITIYGKIVGGSNNANYEYGMATHTGGLTTPLEAGTTDKVHLKIHSKFRPKYLRYPDNDWRKATLEDELRDDQGNMLFRTYDGGVAKAFRTRTYDESAHSYSYSDEYTGLTYLQPGSCNIYGGCYNSGKTIGDIKIELYSDMLRFGDSDVLELHTREQTVVNCINGIGQKTWHPFTVVGGGYGAGTSVFGNIVVQLLPTINTTAGRKVTHPSCAAVFGGAQEGLVVGNTTIEMRDGTVLANIYGASESSNMYGSTQIIIGYPEHYECLVDGMYTLRRADIYSQNAKNNAQNSDGSQVVKQNVWYRAGDIVPKNVYEQIIAAAETEDARGILAAKFRQHNEDSPSNLVEKATWDDIEISVGDPASRNARTADEILTTPYFGHGNVYGGGYVPTGGNSALIGQKTLKKFTETNKPVGADASITNYGGNSSIMIWDNPENAAINAEGTGYKFAIGSTASGDGASGAVIKDHVSIGSGKFIPVNMTEGKNKMGLFYYKPESGESPAEFVHQPSGKYSATADAGKKFYEIESDGGIYGGGRKVFCEGFLACDLAYYGYADFAPQMAKLINTFQHFDLLSITDCCLQLQAAQDFASTTTDAGEKYSITRVGELRMNSSLAGKSVTLNPGVEDKLNIGNTNHLEHRSRNFLGFYRSVKYLGALVSNVGFDEDPDKLHDKTGAEVDSETYLTNKQKIVNTYYAAKAREKKDNTQPVTNKEADDFKQRNVGTSANMIGINNGYSLTIQGTRQAKEGDNTVDKGYYGPAIGVTEIKLLTMAIGEGGGYVYALNQHKEEGNKTPNFMQTLGNFVFPGAWFGLKKETQTLTIDGVEQVEEKEVPCVNYIIDDCHPVGHGYDEYIECDGSCDLYTHSPDRVNVNKEQEIHYWYVNGQRYFFNATLTAYTGIPTEEKPSSLYTLSSAENLLLAGLEKGNNSLHIKSIKWEAPNDDYDLTRDTDSETQGTQLVPGYELYISVGNQPQELIKPTDPSTKKKGTWSAQLSRKDADEIESTETYDTTMPLLGIALTDAVSNNAKDYYSDHLSQPGKVQVVLVAIDKDGLDYEYTLNLTIVYLKGTDINGNIVIENCALPGERIYANAFDVNVEGDNPTITNRKWVLYKLDTTLVDKGNVESTTPMDDIDIPNIFLVDENSPERIAIPAYYWMNGWHLAYQMNINGKTERVYVSADDDTEHKSITVHNYHRMMAWDRDRLTSDNAPDIQDLQLTAGARVYIEDADDLNYFLTYMSNVQDANCSKHGMIGTTELPSDYDSHVVVNPRYAEGIHFILLNDVKMSDDVKTAQTYQFAGCFSGLGHAIDMNKCPQFMGENLKNGSIYFTGFRSQGITTVVGTNNGRIFGSYHHNTSKTGNLIGVAGADNRLQYCFQNSYPGLNDCNDYTTYYDDLDFANGKAAYDLNAFYLNERYKQVHVNENDHFESYVHDYYSDGEYRYANWDKAERKGTPTALRTDPHPNYYLLARITAEEMDALTSAGASVSAGIGAAAFSKAKTYHNCNHTPDASRLVPGHTVEVLVDGDTQSEWIPDCYEPIYPQDFMYWGQDMQAGDQYPKTITADGQNRVFRASGFYGTQEDRGFYFNRAEALMRHPRLTAVDFTGQRTRDRVPSLDQSAVYCFEPLQYVVGGKAKQTIIFAPVLDLPTSGEAFKGTDTPALMELSSISIDGNTDISEVGKVTKNLLVYIPADKVRSASFAQDNEADIEAHRIEWDGTYFTTANFHLVDMQDFNAPIAFSVTSRAWYEREPLHYSSRKKSVANRFVIGKDAWEGISLPFTAMRVKAVNNTTPGSTYTDRGEISHFYGEEETHHDYWLRGLIDTAEDKVSLDDDVIASADFARPGAATSEAQLFDLNADQATADYVYNNNWLYQTYGNKGYVSDHNEYDEPITFANYRFLTKNAPYIVAYPGVDYYEFDLSGEFFESKTNVANGQKIVYENSAVPFAIEITDEEADKRHTVVTGADGVVTTHYGTFAHLADNNYFVLNDDEVDNVEIYNDIDKENVNVSLPAGSAFINCKDFGIDEVLPFRTYMTVSVSQRSPAPQRLIMIGSGTTKDNPFVDDDEKSEDAYDGVDIYVKDNNIVIASDHDFMCPLYGVNGIFYRYLEVKSGVNIYRNLTPGIYIALGKKLLIR